MKLILLLFFLFINITTFAQSEAKANVVPVDTTEKHVVQRYHIKKDSTLRYDLIITKIDSVLILLELKRIRDARNEERKGW